MRQRFKLTAALTWGLLLLPTCVLGVLIFRHSVNVPYMDQWGIGYLFAKVIQGTASFPDFYAQHNESRFLFPRMVFIGIGLLTHWNVKYEMLLTFLLACVIAFNIYRLSELTVPVGPARRVLLALLANLLIFSLIQYDDWMFSLNFVYFIPLACLTTCLRIAHSRYGAQTKFLLCMILAIVSTFSYANGLLCWVVVLPALAWSQSWAELRSKQQLIALWVAAFAVVTALYFYGYQKPPHHPSLMTAVRHPLRATLHQLCLLGSPLAFNSRLVACAVGLGIVMLFSAACFYLWRYRADFALTQQAIGWVMIGVYAFLSAALITIGRSGWGVGYALTPRYTTFTVYLIISLLYLTALILNHASSAERLPAQAKSSTWRVGFVSCLVFGLLLLHGLTTVVAFREMKNKQRTQWQAKACLLLIDFDLQEEQCEKTGLTHHAGVVRKIAGALDSAGFLRPALIKADQMREIVEVRQPGSASSGTFEDLRKLDEQTYMASGWAVLPSRGGPADAVILTYRDTAGNDKIFAMSEVEASWDDQTGQSPLRWLWNSLRGTQNGQTHERERTLRWHRRFALSEISTPAVEIKAWAFDADKEKAFELEGTRTLETAATTAAPPQ